METGNWNFYGGSKYTTATSKEFLLFIFFLFVEIRFLTLNFVLNYVKKVRKFQNMFVR